MSASTPTRRTVLQTAAATAALAAPFVRGAFAAGQAQRRLLGSLGARRQRRDAEHLQGMGGQGKGRF
jgi:hypothetical protein